MKTRWFSLPLSARIRAPGPEIIVSSLIDNAPNPNWSVIVPVTLPANVIVPPPDESLLQGFAEVQSTLLQAPSLWSSVVVTMKRGPHFGSDRAALQHQCRFRHRQTHLESQDHQRPHLLALIVGNAEAITLSMAGLKPVRAIV
jgi:hypothetical protein